MATTIVWASTFTGAPSADDVLAANKLVREENARRTAQNLILAAQTPPGTPLTMLPSDTPANLKASALTIMSANQTSWWASYATQAQADEARISAADKQEMLGIVNTKLDAGKTLAQIKTALNAV